MNTLTPLFSPRSITKAPAAISATTSYHFPPFSLVAVLKTHKNPTLKKRSSKSTIDIIPSSIIASPPEPITKKVLVPIGFGTEEMEAVIMIDVFRRAGADVTVASVEDKLEVEAFGGTRLVADALISACSPQIFDLVALPGGMPGSARLRDCKILQDITTKQAEGNRFYAAICAAPAVTLMPWGLLKRKKSTCHPAFMDKLSSFRAVKSNLQVSGELTTSRGPGTSFEFAVCLVEQLFGESKAKEVCEATLLHVGTEDTRKEEFNEVSWSLDHPPQVLIPVANGCEEIDVITIVDILRRAKANVILASVGRSLKILGSNGTSFMADRTISTAAESTYDLIILPGGTSAAEQLIKSRILKKLLKDQESSGRMFAALGSSPVILQKQGLIKDKRTTAHPSVISMLSDVVTGAKVVIDGELITSKGLSTAIDFALAVVSKLFGHARARSVAEGLVFEYPK